jgi:hypothetical protein
METCTVETGLLKKKPCGEPSVTHCVNCEQALCGKHAVPQLSAGRKTGKFLCKECSLAHREHEKAVGTLPQEKPKPAAAPAPKAAAAPSTPPAAKPAAPAAAPAAPKKEEDSLGAIDFTPTKK